MSAPPTTAAARGQTSAPDTGRSDMALMRHLLRLAVLNVLVLAAIAPLARVDDRLVLLPVAAAVLGSFASYARMRRS